VWNASST